MRIVLMARKRSILHFMLLVVPTLVIHSRAEAQFQIESFTRFRIESFDNNNNGYAIDTEQPIAWGEFERRIIAEDLITTDDLPLELSTPQPTQPVRRDESFIVSENGNRAFPSSGESTHAVNNFMQSRGVAFERVLRLSSTSSNLVPVRLNGDFCLGMRFLEFDDYQRVAVSGLAQALPHSYHYGSFQESNTLGPYLGLHGSMHRGNWRIRTAGNLHWAFSDSVAGLQIFYDEYSVHRTSPSLLASRTHSQASQSEMLLGEMRMQATRKISTRTALNIGYSGFYFGARPVLSRSVGFSPESGLSQAIDDAFVGIAYANLEFVH